MSAPKSIPSDRIMLNEVAHICIVVRNVERAAEAFALKFGIGPWSISLVHTPPSRASVHGEPAEYTLKFAHAKAGPVVLELVEAVDGESICQEFLEIHGEGLHHIGLPTPTPFEEELKKWQRLGIRPLQVNRMEDPEEGWAYMDTKDLIGCVLEILSFRRYR